jgi:hypothetical protein
MVSIDMMVSYTKIRMLFSRKEWDPCHHQAVSRPLRPLPAGLHCEKPCSVQNVRKCTEQISKKEEDFTTLYKLFMALLKRQYIFASARLQHFLFSSSLDLTAQMSCHLARSCPCFGDGAKKCFLLYQIHDMLGSKETMNDRYTPLRGYQKPTVSVVIKKNRCHPFYTLLVG